MCKENNTRTFTAPIGIRILITNKSSSLSCLLVVLVILSSLDNLVSSSVNSLYAASHTIPSALASSLFYPNAILRHSDLSDWHSPLSPPSPVTSQPMAVWRYATHQTIFQSAGTSPKMLFTYRQPKATTFDQLSGP